ncbi:hypothetical protein [Novosphingobium sp. BL-52-GroH]|uniref:hypothetical protein n=1 Tax=Novosphingobium sp. BL-52-GroH TaxID=3349877 RepID=UPI00384EB69A
MVYALCDRMRLGRNCAADSHHSETRAVSAFAIEALLDPDKREHVAGAISADGAAICEVAGGRVKVMAAPHLRRRSQRILPAHFIERLLR